ncbi:isoprenylcysteine carboxylmethyltransferase family protein [Pseudomonas sp. MAP12]|uniref:Isoprenylcysteine carboxylmethyltransferase family protein n=1 Tax=Geopseudomonas aromaticivorans TaxID=2849492 RepID=A0ABS6MZE9_9GAMM|nr:isoprenylcysteine carboxylmethyltransferase family protein [Pseudomonas aromaticivorans]MBV2134184.1 isoprenylcysteine carboxylmethyltransferase family protein [Pseudomonas aromaticivorans]
MSLLFPPPLVVVLLAGLMWQLARHLPFGGFAFALQRPLAGLVALAGLGLMAAAAWTMLRARTTVNPLKPERATQLVTGGVFARSRNPIYLGDALILVALVLVFGNWLNFLLLPLFVGFIGRFQIAPEERALQRLFGDEYRAYCARVRRWL